MIKIGSQFSGVGAFDTALKRLNINFENVYQAEWDKYARKTYLANNEEPEYYVEDVNNTPISEITEKHGSLDIVMFSPPCQAFSLAGKRLGKNDPKGRGILFFNSLEFIEQNKPRFFIFENVKGLLSDDGGNTFNEWLNYLGGKSVNGTGTMFPIDGCVPYHIYWKVLNAKDYGVPQNRERVFIVGIRDDKDSFFNFPKVEPLTKRLKDVLEAEVEEKYYLSEKMVNYLGGAKRSIDFGNKDTEKAPCLNAVYFKTPTDGFYIEDPKICAMRGRKKETENYEQSIELNENGVSNSLTTVQKDNLVVEPKIDYDNVNLNYRHHFPGFNGFDNLCPTIKSSEGSGNQILINKIRKLTPIEAFRLMDFPDSLVENARKAGVSDSQLYRQAGNSIVVAVLEKIIKNLKL
jgi:DNA (cytosine-5)-methyltransferase 1